MMGQIVLGNESVMRWYDAAQHAVFQKQHILQCFSFSTTATTANN